MPQESDGEDRPEDTLANDSVRYLLLRMQLPTMHEVKALDRRRRQTGKILGTSRQFAECSRALKQSTNLVRTYGAMALAGTVLWLGTVAASEQAAAFASAVFLFIVVVLGCGILAGLYFTYHAFREQQRHAARLEELQISLHKMTAALAPELAVERVVAEAKRSHPKFEAERHRVEGVKETVKILRSNVAGFWHDVMVTMQEAEIRQIEANIDPAVVAEAQQYMLAWGSPPMLVDAKAEPRFGWSGYTDDQLRQWDHWSHLVTSASGSRRALQAMGINLPTHGPIQLPPEIIPHSNRWQEGRGIEVGQGISTLQEKPVADFEAALNFGEGAGQARFLSLVAPSERSQTDELLNAESE